MRTLQDTQEFFDREHVTVADFVEFSGGVEKAKKQIDILSKNEHYLLLKNGAEIWDGVVVYDENYKAFAFVGRTAPGGYGNRIIELVSDSDQLILCDN